MQIHIELDPDSIEILDLKWFYRYLGEHPEVKKDPLASIEGTQEILAHFVVDDATGQRMEHDKAYELTGHMKLTQMAMSFEALANTMDRLNETFVPPAKAPPSSPPSGTGEQAQTGSESSLPRKNGESLPG